MTDPDHPSSGADERPPRADHASALNRPSVTDPETVARHAEYWRRNVRYVGSLLVVWFVVSYGFGIVLAAPLNAFTLPGTNYPLGFWFAQQGAIYVFVILIFVYVRLMNGLDREFDVDEGTDA
jgi:putative solute:sodium symporter small subunit